MSASDTILALLEMESMNMEGARLARPAWMQDALVGPIFGGCLSCPPKPDVLPMDALLAVGFGMVVLSRDGAPKWSGDDETVTAQYAEDMAALDDSWVWWNVRYPNHDWRLQFLAPMSEVTYQRHGPERWVPIARGLGFA